MKSGEPAGEACLAPTPAQAHVTDPLPGDRSTPFEQRRAATKVAG